MTKWMCWSASPAQKSPRSKRSASPHKIPDRSESPGTHNRDGSSSPRIQPAGSRSPSPHKSTADVSILAGLWLIWKFILCMLKWMLVKIICIVNFLCRNEAIMWWQFICDGNLFEAVKFVCFYLESTCFKLCLVMGNVRMLDLYVDIFQGKFMLLWEC